MDNRLNRIAGLGALLSAALLPLAMLVPLIYPATSARQLVLREDISEYLVLLAPVALLPVALALGRLYQQRSPLLGRLSARLGLIALLPYGLLMVYGFLQDAFPQLVPQGDTADLLLNWLRPLALALLLLIGLWLLAAGALSIASRNLPAPLGLLQILAGLSWSLLVLGLFFNLFAAGSALAVVAALAFPAWAMAHFLWCGWLGLWLLRRLPSPALPAFQAG